MTVAEFRARYPEFSDDSVYPDLRVQDWLDTADKFLVSARWGTSLSLGIGLFTAHFLALGRQSELSAGQNSSAPGTSSGVLASKSLGGASASYENIQGLFNDAGAWALTSYGRQYWTLIRLVGMGGMQL